MLKVTFLLTNIFIHINLCLAWTLWLSLMSSSYNLILIIFSPDLFPSQLRVSQLEHLVCLYLDEAILKYFMGKP